IHPYTQLHQQGKISDILYDNPQDIYDIIEGFMRNFTEVESVYASLEKFCLTEFNSDNTTRVIKSLFNSEPKIDSLDLCKRINNLKIAKILIQAPYVEKAFPSTLEPLVKPNFKNMKKMIYKTIIHYLNKV